MSEAYSTPRGVYDILPEKARIWNILINEAKKIFEIYGYKEIITPVFENTGVFTRSIGEGTDIVQKEMYTFDDKAGRSLTLRPEGTAGIVRAYLQNNLYNQAFPVKLFYVGPMYRYERPQAGRQREFWQMGVEVFGSNDPAIDVETIEMLVNYLYNVGIDESIMELFVNSMGCKNCRIKYMNNLSKYLENIGDLCNQCKTRIKINPLRIFDCKNEECRGKLADSPKLLDFICDECRNHFEAVKKYLDGNSIKYQINPMLVRGFDYYTRTTYEIQLKGLGAQNAVAGGGRYDYLVEEFGGSQTPAVGFAIGMERLLLATSSKYAESGNNKIDVFIATTDESLKNEAVKLVSKLRKKNIVSEIDYLERSLKSQFKYADKVNAKKVIILGSEEYKRGECIIKDMISSNEKIIKIENILSEVGFA